MVGQLLELLYGLAEYLVLAIKALWPLLLALLVFRFATLLFGLYSDIFIDGFSRKRRFKKMGDDSDQTELLHKIRTLHPREFEFYVADILSKNGFKTKVVSHHGQPDGGVDIVARRKGKHYLVQCKKFINSDVGVRHLREFYGVGADLRYEKDAKLIFISTTYFTKTAKKFAKAKDIKLIDADYLSALVFYQADKGRKIGFNGHDRSEVMRQVEPACPVCTRQLAWRRGPHGDFVGCSGYPQCRYTFSSPRDTGQPSSV